MTEKEICKICDNYGVDTKCDFKDKCKLIAFVRENKSLKAEIKAIKKELATVKKEFAELKSIRSWELCPDRMGK